MEPDAEPDVACSEASIPACGEAARRAGPAALAHLLRATRADTLATFDRYAQALVRRSMQVPQRDELNPPLWELGHVGWFQAWWLARNPQRGRGALADPGVVRATSARPDADALYDSSAVPHDTRWSLPLPDADATRADLADQLETTLTLLGDTPDDDAALYFFRLALFHEDMHHEAALYMAQSLDIAIDDPRWQAPRLPAPPPPLRWAASTFRVGWQGPGFAFDNELGMHDVTLGATEIDAQVLRWRDYLPCLGADAAPPRYLKRDGGTWLQRRHGRWQPLDLDAPASHLTLYEAEAWCRWAGRRLPTEAEWERAAVEGASAFRWGDVWEWTTSPFEPYPGFTPHPYRDYSAPWFGSRQVLRGGSHLTQPRMKHPRYRNFFTRGRNDIVAGLRSCSR